MRWPGKPDAYANGYLHSRKAAAGAMDGGSPYPTTIVRYGFAQTATDFYVFGGVDDGFTTNAVNKMTSPREPGHRSHRCHLAMKRHLRAR